MKPIKLIMSAFGPYATEMPPIEFSQFEDKGVFLITGDTGAGKTTIFDAICFALYGNTSGKYRDSKNLRSEYAKESQKSYVDFYFSHQGTEYHIHREPSFLRKKKKGGEGWIEEKEVAILYIGNEKPVEGKTKVDSKIIELLEIEEPQFKQIAMIAQGEFLGLLNSDTKERTKILRKIFQTYHYNELDDKLKGKKKDAEREKEDLVKEMKIYLEDIRFEDLQDLEDGTQSVSQRLELKKQELKNAKDVINVEELFDVIEEGMREEEETLVRSYQQFRDEEQVLRQQQEELTLAETNNQTIEEYQEALREKNQLEAKKSEIDAKKKELEKRITATRNIYPLWVQWKSDEEQLRKNLEKREQTQSQIKDAKKKDEMLAQFFETVQNQEAQGKDYTAQAVAIEKDERNYKERDNIQEQVQQLTKEEDDVQAQMLQFESQRDKIESQMHERIRKIAEYENVPELLVKSESEFEKMQQSLQKMSDLRENQYRKLLEKQREKENAQSNFLEKEIFYKRIHERYERAQDIFRRNSAGLLAANLQPDEMCPVCGSIHHPKLATLSSDSVTQEELEALKRQDEESRFILEDAADIAKGFIKEIHLQEETITRELGTILTYRETDLNSDSPLEEQMKVLESEISRVQLSTSKLQNEISEFKKKKKQLEQEKAEQNHQEQLRIELEEKINGRMAQKVAVREKLSGKKALLESLKKLPFENWNEALRVKLSLEDKANEIGNQIEHARKLKLESEKCLVSLETSKAHLEEEIEQQKKMASESKYRLDEETMQSNFEDTDAMLAFVSEESDIKQIETEIQTYETHVKVNELKTKDSERKAAGKVRIDVNELSQKIQVQEMVVKNVQNTIARAEARKAQNQKNLDRIKEKQTELEEKARRFTIYTRLSNLVSGTTGNGKLTLEQYIQSAGFDGILQAANRRLTPMSDNQYRLIRKKGELGKQSQNFLDLEVMDYFTGHSRPVGNLSGGESFKASLSLALGLSDTVSSSRGGIQMDALFIDEGFGTLDQKSIQNTMDILLGISQTNKLVGIISHREELKENIGRQIIVKKENDGSHIFIKNDEF